MHGWHWTTHNSSIGDLLTGAAILLLLFLIGYFIKRSGRFGNRLRRGAALASESRRLSQAERTPISDAKAGDIVTLCGKVELLETLHAPFSGRACASYTLQVEEHTTGWGLRDEEEDSRDFVLVDEAGSRAIIDGVLLKLLLTKDKHGATGQENDGEVWELLKRFGIQKREQSRPSTARSVDLSAVRRRRFRIREGALEAGEVVTVQGVAVWEDDPDGQAPGGGYRDGTRPKRLRITGEGGGYVLVQAVSSARCSK